MRRIVAECRERRNRRYRARPATGRPIAREGQIARLATRAGGISARSAGHSLASPVAPTGAPGARVRVPTLSPVPPERPRRSRAEPCRPGGGRPAWAGPVDHPAPDCDRLCRTGGRPGARRTGWPPQPFAGASDADTVRCGPDACALPAGRGRPDPAAWRRRAPPPAATGTAPTRATAIPRAPRETLRGRAGARRPAGPRPGARRRWACAARGPARARGRPSRGTARAGPPARRGRRIHGQGCAAVFWDGPGRARHCADVAEIALWDDVKAILSLPCWYGANEGCRGRAGPETIARLEAWPEIVHRTRSRAGRLAEGARP